MRYHRYYPIDVLNGPGTRATLFISGCEHRCPECYNQSTWSFKSGKPFTKELRQRILNDLQDEIIPRAGFSLSGGDPLHPRNIADVTKLLSDIKHHAPKKNIWVWTGYYYAELTKEQRIVLDLIDVLVDGPFISALRSRNLVWRGSSNQTIHYLSAQKL